MQMDPGHRKKVNFLIRLARKITTSINLNQGRPPTDNPKFVSAVVDFGKKLDILPKWIQDFLVLGAPENPSGIQLIEQIVENGELLIAPPPRNSDGADIRAT